MTDDLDDDPETGLSLSRIQAAREEIKRGEWMTFEEFKKEVTGMDGLEEPQPCWFGIFCPPHCPNEGRWRAPEKLWTCGLMRDAVWCDKHKHDTDVLIRDEEEENHERRPGRTGATGT